MSDEEEGDNECTLSVSINTEGKDRGNMSTGGKIVNTFNNFPSVLYLRHLHIQCYTAIIIIHTALIEVLKASDRKEKSLPQGSPQQTDPAAEDDIPPILYRYESSTIEEGVCSI